MKSFIKEAIKDVSANYIDVRIEDSYLTEINYNNNNLDLTSQIHIYGASVRAFVNGGWGFVTLNNLEHLKDAARTAAYIANIVSNERKEKTGIASSNKLDVEVKAEMKNDFRNLNIEDKKNILNSYNKTISFFSSKTNIRSCIKYFDNFKNVYFYNSEGSYISQEKADLAMKVDIYNESNDLSSFETGSSNDFDIIKNNEEKIEDICRNSINLLKTENVKSGIYTAILNPSLAGLFIHEAFGHLSEADNVYEDNNLKNIMVLGRRFGNEIFNVYDTGSEEGKRGYLIYDDEGIKSKKTYLIKDGLLTGRLNNRETAFKLNEDTTGNARAINYKFPPVCRMRTICIENGSSTFEEMISGIKFGIYALDGSEGETNGELFTFTAGKAFIIKNGKITEMVKNVKLSGNVFKTLMNITMIGNDFAINESYKGCSKGDQSSLSVSSVSPHIKIENLIIA